MTKLLIGIDDTDNRESRGTGYLARLLLDLCRDSGLRPLGVTRHQFLVDPRIPYTSHNSGACLAVQTSGGAQSAGLAFEFVARRAEKGSDPGVCVARADGVPVEVIQFGRRAASEVVEMAEALGLAEQAGADLRPLGGSGLGVIGALASVGLRAGGNDGRFIQLPGLRELPGRVRLDELARLGIRLVCSTGLRPVSAGVTGGTPVLLRPGDACDTLGWVRPRLVGGEPVLPVQWDEEQNAWVPVDRKHSV